MNTLEEYIDGFYSNDYTDKLSPKGYNEFKVQAYEMRVELQRLILNKHQIKTGFKGKRGSPNRIYVIYYK